MKNKNIIYWSAFISLFVLAGAVAAHAQFADADSTVTTTTTASPIYVIAPSPSSCVTLNTALYFGAYDGYTNGDVTRLQTFLISRGYLNADATGFFGMKTLAAVIDFQRRTGITPIGVVGPLTRAMIMQVSCGTVTPPAPPVTPPVSTAYTPVIHNINIPSLLAPGQTGTWTVTASDPLNGQLSYSVLWGDESVYGGALANTSAYQIPAAYSNTASFTHAYSQPGTYTVRFTVQNSSGQSASFSVTANVSGQGQAEVQAPQIYSISPTSGGYGTFITINGYGFTSSNTINFGNSVIASGVSSPDGRTLTFSTPANPCVPGGVCTMMILAPSNQPITVTNQNGTSNAANFFFNTTGGSASSGGVDQTLSLSVGQQATVNGDLSIEPTAIIEDSRCPSGTACFQAGSIVVATQLAPVNGSLSQTANLSLGTKNNPTFVTSQEYTVRLVSVSPDMTQNSAINTGSYVFTYEVTR